MSDPALSDGHLAVGAATITWCDAAADDGRL